MTRWLILFLFIITGCSSDLVQLREIEPKGSLFQTYLAREYLNYSEAEAEQYDWLDSGYFADKGLDASIGKRVDPEILRHRNLPEDVLPTLTQARAHLLQVLDSDASNKYPKDTAKALFMFDCWVEQEEEQWQEDHINYCRENFYFLMDKLFGLLEEDRVRLAEEVPEEEITLAKEGKLAEKVMFEPVEDDACPEFCVKREEKQAVYFEFNRFGLTKRAKRVVAKISEDLKSKKKYTITLNGYADRVGSEDYNMKLSRKRALAIKKELVGGGADENSITVFAFGEIHGLLETEDNMREPENRAVEIVVEM